MKRSRSYECYLALQETAHGKRYWRTGSDPDTLKLLSPDRTISIFGPAIVGPDGYSSEKEAARAIAGSEGIDLDNPDTW